MTHPRKRTSSMASPPVSPKAVDIDEALLHSPRHHHSLYNSGFGKDVHTSSEYGNSNGGASKSGLHHSKGAGRKARYIFPRLFNDKILLLWTVIGMFVAFMVWTHIYKNLNEMLSARGERPARKGGVSTINLISSRGGLWGEPTVLLLTPFFQPYSQSTVRNYLKVIEELEYPKDHISLAFLFENKDKAAAEAYAEIQRFAEGNIDTYYRIVVVDYTDGNLEDGSGLAQLRFSRMRNALLTTAIRDEDWVMWADMALAAAPRSLLQDLLSLDRDCLAASCLTASGAVYDKNSRVNFQLMRELGKEVPLYAGREGARALSSTSSALSASSLVELDNAGASLLLVRGKIYREGLMFPIFPVDGEVGVAGHLKVLRKMGRRCFGLPDYHVLFAAE